MTLLVVPGWLRQSNLYRAIVAGLLRIVIELVGDARNIMPPQEIGAGELARRKVAGNVIELAGLLSMGWSPLWLFAVAADLTGGSRTYLKMLIEQLQRDGLLTPDADINSVDELLANLESASSVVAAAIDTPPLNVADMRASWRELRRSAAGLPNADRLARTYELMRQVARQEGRPLWSVSALVAAGAARAGVRVGKLHIFDFYDQSLRAIASEGYFAYARRVARPYSLVAASHFDPQRITFTERLLGRRRRP